jgi:hypothetical protein
MTCADDHSPPRAVGMPALVQARRNGPQTPFPSRLSFIHPALFECELGHMRRRRGVL